MTFFSKVVVLRKHNKMQEDKLRTHGADVVKATYQVAAYEAVKDEADKVKTTYDTFEAACIAAANGGTSLTETKNKAKGEFLLALDALGTALQLTVKDDLTYITNAHYEYLKQGAKSTEPLPDPELDSVEVGVLSGTVKGKVKEFPKGVTAIAVEYSDDDGLTWKNGTYSTGKKFKLSGLDIRKEYLVRVIYHGTVQRKSNPSKPLPVFVL